MIECSIKMDIDGNPEIEIKHKFDFKDISDRLIREFLKKLEGGVEFKETGYFCQGDKRQTTYKIKQK